MIKRNSDSQISISIKAIKYIFILYKLKLKSLEKIFYRENVYKVAVCYRRACESSYHSVLIRYAHAKAFVDNKASCPVLSLKLTV